VLLLESMAEINLSKIAFLCCLVSLCAAKQPHFFENSEASQFTASVVKADATLPIGVPLAGYNHGPRRVPYWPIPQLGNYTTWMMPSVGIIDPTWVKVLVLDNGSTQLMFVTLDGVGSDGGVNQKAYDYAVLQGLDLPYENIIFSSSHSHSGPGALSTSMLWALAPATDLMVPEVQAQLAQSTADAMIKATKTLKPAKIDIGIGNLVGVTVNRRAGLSPYVKSSTIDPHLGVIAVNNMDGTPMATLWNFAIHGVCYGPENMEFSGDIMGGVCEVIEQQVGGVALFMNADAGDIDPGPGVCDNKPNYKGAPIIAAAVAKTRSSLKPTNVNIQIEAHSEFIGFGVTDLNATFQRFDNCTDGGPLDICTFCEFFKCDLNAHLPESWIEENPKFSAFSLVINGVSTVIVSIPGEALLELGWWIRNDTKDLGFDQTLLAGYSNSHMGYFATPNEYDIGGYESQLTFWGIDTASKIRSSCKKVASAVVP